MRKIPYTVETRKTPSIAVGYSVVLFGKPGEATQGQISVRTMNQEQATPYRLRAMSVPISFSKETGMTFDYEGAYETRTGANYPPLKQKNEPMSEEQKRLMDVCLDKIGYDPGVFETVTPTQRPLIRRTLHDKFAEKYEQKDEMYRASGAFNLAPDEIGLPAEQEFRVRIPLTISTPMGGQPGYRLK